MITEAPETDLFCHYCSTNSWKPGNQAQSFKKKEKKSNEIKRVNIGVEDRICNQVSSNLLSFSSFSDRMNKSTSKEYVIGPEAKLL